MWKRGIHEWKKATKVIHNARDLKLVAVQDPNEMLAPSSTCNKQAVPKHNLLYKLKLHLLHAALCKINLCRAFSFMIKSYIKSPRNPALLFITI